MSEYKLVPVELLSELAESLASELDTRYPDSIRSYESQERKYQAEMEPVLTARQIIANSPEEQGEPVAWIRKWSLDGEKPSKERNKNGRMAFPMKFKLHEVTRNRCLPDDVALYTATQPTPDVSALVEALARCRQQASYTIGDIEALQNQLNKIRDIANEAIAAHRKGGEK